MEGMQPKVMNRWLVVVGAILIQLCLGAIYAWSVFTPSLEPTRLFTLDGQFAAMLQGTDVPAEVRAALTEQTTQLKADGKWAGDPFVLPVEVAMEVEESGARWLVNTTVDGEEVRYRFLLEEKVNKETSAKTQELHFYDVGAFDLTTTQSQWIFGVGLATFAVVMVLAGQWQARSGPTIVARVGGLILGIGYVLGGLVGTSFPILLVTIGLLGGAGIGLAYVVPIAVGVKWFPDKKGMITGLAVAGFGFGATIWVKVAGSWGHLIESFGVSQVFMFYGIAFFVLVQIGAIWMKNPPEGWSPAGWSPGTGGAAAAAGTGASLEPKQMLRTPQFYMLWSMFIFGAMAGLMTIGIIKTFGIEALRERSGMTIAEASAAAGTAMGVFFAISNGLGRILWGIMSDKLGRKMSLFLMMAIQGVVMLGFFWMGGTEILLYVGAALIGFNFGGNFALFPAATADFFGNKTVGRNYGWMFTAYGVGGIAGPQIAAQLRASGAGEGLSAWMPAFIICGVACLLAAVIALLLKQPKALAAPAE
jgi:OFA family oxalate/formate antiporter-like MFS transporter